MTKGDNLSPKERKEVKKEIQKAIPSKIQIIRSEFKNRTSTAIITAFGLLIALSWQGLITKVVNNITNSNLLEKYPYLADLYSTFIITAISVFGILIVNRWAQKTDNK